MFDRRQLLQALAATGVGTALFHQVLVDQEEEISLKSIQEAEWITGLELTDEQREEILSRVQRTSRSLEELRAVPLSPEVPLSIRFSPTSHLPQCGQLVRSATPTDAVVPLLPASDEAIAFLPVHQLSWLIRTRKLTSCRLTGIYLERLKRYGDLLHCVVTLTEDLAWEQARRADDELARGIYRGPLHGIPWGAKDLISVPGYPTTWGIPHYRDRQLDHLATVAQRLEAAGAVLVAKLSLGALAQGDKWFGGMTRSPWDPSQGSSGSSAGSAAATIGGLVGFSLGSETLGSIVSPSIRCGASSLRPTFGRVSRDGCMPLSWSLDKIGPICRAAEDCALVFDAIHGADSRDPTAGSYPFCWPLRCSWQGLRVGYTVSRRRPDAERDDLAVLESLGCKLVEVTLPDSIPLGPMTEIISVEAASVFDDLLRAGHTEGWNTWDEDFRAAQYLSAVDYVRIQRARTLVMQQFDEFMQDVDVLVNANDLLHTNFTGHPSVVLPLGYREGESGPRPIPMVLTGHLNQDDRLLALARDCQSRLTAHQQHPDLEAHLRAQASAAPAEAEAGS